jgi:hypothetical protein
MNPIRSIDTRSIEQHNPSMLCKDFLPTIHSKWVAIISTFERYWHLKLTDLDDALQIFYDDVVQYLQVQDIHY